MEEKPIQFLLVEDNPGDTRLFKEFLKPFGESHFHMDHDSSLRDCLDRLHHKPEDVVLLDLSLPDSVGLETLRKVHETSPQVPIIVLTGNQDETLAMDALKNGAQDYLIKGRIDGSLLARSMQYAIERFHLFQKVKEEQGRYELAALGANDGLWDWDMVTNRVYYSPRWKLLLGYKDDEIGESLDEWFKRIHPEDAARVSGELSNHLSKSTPHFASEHRLRNVNGHYRWVLCRGIAVFNALDKAVRIAGSLTDITKHKDLEQRLAQQAYYDPLTRLPNRILFMENLKRAFAHTKRNPRYLFAVLYLDMDRFKSINDHFGHQAGDDLLSEFAKRLSSCLRPNDFVARMAGDEFNVLLDDLKEPGEAVTIAERILADLRSPFTVSNTETLVSTSIGIAYSNLGCTAPDELLKAADNAMYGAKMSGKACYQIYDPAKHVHTGDV